MVSDRILNSKLLLFVTIGACIAVCGCNSAAQSQRPAQPPPPEVVVKQVDATDVPVISQYPAQTYARNTVDVRGRVDGYIDKWLFRPGQEVHAGDTLYVLDVRPYQAAVEQAKGNLSQSEADLEFARKQVALLQAQANLAAAQANLVKAQQDFDRLTPLVKDEAAAQQDLDTRSRGAAGRRSHRAGESGQRGPDAPFHAHANFLHRGESRRAARSAAHRRAQPGIRDHSRADQRTDRRYSGAGGRSGDRQRSRSHSPPSFRWTHLGAIQSDRIAYLSFKKKPRLLQSPLTLFLADGSGISPEGPYREYAQSSGSQNRHTGIASQLSQSAAHAASGTVRPGTSGDRVAHERDPDSTARHAASAKCANRVYGGLRRTT